MKTPKLYGWFHLMFLGILLIGIILILRFIKLNQKKKDLITDISLAVYGDYYDIFNNDYSHANILYTNPVVKLIHKIFKNN